MHDDLISLYAYNRWADHRVVSKLLELNAEQYTQEPAPGWPSIRSTLVHIAGSTDVWARRLEGEVVTVRPTEADFPNLADAEQLLAKSHAAFDRLLATITPEQLAAVWSYRNFAGQDCSLPLWTVYRHVVNHATYHRGQIASKLGRLGVDPPVTDFVYWAIETSK